ncbi:MAG: CPBP family glutamic-type intramembrane protease [Bacteroidetes bacterium]|nr:CPBP family glutamic-type intramembrane protease [Bacteroidota bacterium]
MKNALLSHLSPVAKIFFVLMLVTIGLMLAVLGGLLLTMIQYHTDMAKAVLLLSSINDPASIPLLKELQILQSVLLFIVPALIAGMLFEQGTAGYFGMKILPAGQILLLILVIMMVSLPLINWMVSLNEMMKLPAAFAGIEQWMKDAEDQASQVTEKFLDVQSFGGFAVNMLMIAIIPAIGEELLFRGLFQRLLGEWFRNVHVAIFVAAFLFAAIHLQFYGLLPRMMLGVMFGYLYLWTGTIWAPVFAHFLNNGAAVLVSYLSNTGVIHADYENFGSTDNVFLITGSVVFTGMLLYGIFMMSRRIIKNEE